MCSFKREIKYINWIKDVRQTIMKLNSCKMTCWFVSQIWFLSLAVDLEISESGSLPGTGYDLFLFTNIPSLIFSEVHPVSTKDTFPGDKTCRVFFNCASPSNSEIRGALSFTLCPHVTSWLRATDRDNCILSSSLNLIRPLDVGLKLYVVDINSAMCICLVFKIIPTLFCKMKNHSPSGRFWQKKTFVGKCAYTFNPFVVNWF